MELFRNYPSTLMIEEGVDQEQHALVSTLDQQQHKVFAEAEKLKGLAKDRIVNVEDIRPFKEVFTKSVVLARGVLSSESRIRGDLKEEIINYISTIYLLQSTLFMELFYFDGGVHRSLLASGDRKKTFREDCIITAYDSLLAALSEDNRKIDRDILGNINSLKDLIDGDDLSDIITERVERTRMQYHAYKERRVHDARDRTRAMDDSLPIFRKTLLESNIVFTFVEKEEAFENGCDPSYWPMFWKESLPEAPTYEIHKLFLEAPE